MSKSKLNTQTNQNLRSKSGKSSSVGKCQVSILPACRNVLRFKQALLYYRHSRAREIKDQASPWKQNYLKILNQFCKVNGLKIKSDTTSYWARHPEGTSGMRAPDGQRCKKAPVSEQATSGSSLRGRRCH